MLAQLRSGVKGSHEKARAQQEYCNGGGAFEGADEQCSASAGSTGKSDGHTLGKNRDRRQGAGRQRGAKGHGECGGHAGQEYSLREGEDEHQDCARAGPGPGRHDGRQRPAP